MEIIVVLCVHRFSRISGLLCGCVSVFCQVELFNAISRNSYKIVYLSARAIGQVCYTKEFLRKVSIGRSCLPDGPLLRFPFSLYKAFRKQVFFGFSSLPLICRTALPSLSYAFLPSLSYVDQHCISSLPLICRPALHFFPPSHM